MMRDKVVVKCLDALPDLKKFIVVSAGGSGHAQSAAAMEKHEGLPPPVRVAYWHVRALYSEDAINMHPKKQTITMNIGDAKHVFTVQVLNNKKALKAGDELIKESFEVDKPDHLIMPPPKKKAKKT
jgi:hypothetical protein